MRARRASVYRMAAGGSPSTEPKLPWPSTSVIAHVEGLRHAHQGVVDGRVAVRVILAHDLADDLGALARGPVGREAHLVHAEENAAMHGLQAVAHIGQGAAHDHAHGVIEIRPLHLVFDVDGNEVPVASATAGAQRQLWAGWRRGRTLRRIFLIGQIVSLVGDKFYFTKRVMGFCRRFKLNSWVGYRSNYSGARHISATASGSQVGSDSKLTANP